MKKILLFLAVLVLMSAVTIAQPQWVCQDTDGGNNSAVQGLINLTLYADPSTSHGSHIDYCMDPNLLVEYWCNSNNTYDFNGNSTIFCAYGCQGGICVEPPVQAPTAEPTEEPTEEPPLEVACKDIDGGKNYYKGGEIQVDYSNGKKEAYDDFCKDPTTLVEYYCASAKTAAKESVKCTCKKDSLGRGFCFEEGETPVVEESKDISPPAKDGDISGYEKTIPLSEAGFETTENTEISLEGDTLIIKVKNVRQGQKLLFGSKLFVVDLANKRMSRTKKAIAAKPVFAKKAVAIEPAVVSKKPIAVKKAKLSTWKKLKLSFIGKTDKVERGATGGFWKIFS